MKDLPVEFNDRGAIKLNLDRDGFIQVTVFNTHNDFWRQRLMPENVPELIWWLLRWYFTSPNGYQGQVQSDPKVRAASEVL